MFDKIKKQLVESKKGIFIGGLIGGVFWALDKASLLPQMAAIDSPGLIDVVVGKTVEVLSVLSIKLFVAYVLIGATIGFISEFVLKRVMK